MGYDCATIFRKEASTATLLDEAGIENDIRKNATDIGWHYDPHADICLT